MPVMDDCLFCDTENNDPCELHKAEPKPKKLKKRKPAKPTVAAPDTGGTDDWIEPAVPKDTSLQRRVKQAESATMTEDELIFREALRNVAPLLHPTERERFADILQPPRTAADNKRLAQIRRNLDGAAERYGRRVRDGVEEGQQGEQ